jgi:hypothetical protein
MPTVGPYNETGQHGDYNQAVPVWKGGIAVAPGDLVYRDNADGYDKPVSNFTWNTNIATTSGTANAVFRGVSMARRLAGQTADGGKADGNILYTGEYCFPCTALGAAAKPGDLVSFEDFGNSTLANQKVRVTAAAGEAIGRVTQDAAVGATFLWFTLLTPLMFGGPTAPA